MTNNRLNRTDGIAYQVVVNLYLLLASILAIIPFFLLISASLSSNDLLVREGYSFLPRGFTLEAYEYLFKTNGQEIFRAFGITVFVTFVGVMVSVVIGPMYAWPISRSDFKYHKFWTLFVVFTMLFNGGMVSQYIMWTRLFSIQNTIFALIVPNLILPGFFIILYKNYFRINIHSSIVEAAKIDGAGELNIFFSIVYPLSIPIIVTIGLMSALGFWNDWMNGMYYISNDRLYSLQLYLKSIMDNVQQLASSNVLISGGAAQLPSVSIRMAVAVVGIVPILLAYPFFQNAFIAGIALGGVKE